MRWVLVAVVTLSGCSALFDLDAPIRARDASVPDDEDAAPDSIATDALVDAGPDAPLSCPVGYAVVAGSSTRYRYVSDMSRDWASAAADCADDGAGTHLAVIGSSAEAAVMDAAFNNEMWIGLSDRITDGTFLWVTTENTMGYPPASGPPWQTAPGNEPCVLIKDQEFTARDCTLTRHYLCECDGHPNDPSRY